MKALLYLGAEELSYREVADPTPGDGEVLVRIESAGICGSDMHAYLGHDERRPPPLILGHEAAGQIVGGPRSGTRVTINPLVTCGTCRACREGRDNLCHDRQIISMPPRPGAFGELVVIPERNVIEVPDHVTSDQAALAEPIACGWHAVRLAMAQAADFAPRRALVLGGGAIGVGAALSLAAFGIKDVTISEPNPLRRTHLALNCEQDARAPDDIPTLPEFDLVIDGVGFENTRAMASARVRPGGIIMHIGLGSARDGLDLRRMTLQEIAFIGTYTYTAADFRATASAIFDGRLGLLDWIETRPLSEGATAFAEIRAGAVAAPKIVLKPQ